MLAMLPRLLTMLFSPDGRCLHITRIVCHDAAAISLMIVARHGLFFDAYDAADAATGAYGACAIFAAFAARYAMSMANMRAQ